MTFLLNALTHASEVKVEIHPPRPVVGEVFQVFFKIQFTDEEGEPVINFSPYGIEVVDKANQGFSTRTIYANGKLTVTREATVVYDMVANKAGPVHLRDINVQFAGKTLKHSMLSFNVLKEAEVLADIFVMADITKKDVYVGEGIVARYYLYAKVSVNNIDIKKYPKLNNFLKRFLQERESSEYVSVDGQRYMRTLIYAAKLFPEKPGELRIDPLQLTATYSPVMSNDPFSRFGLSRNVKNKTISSESVKIDVKPLPTPAPENFIGLVGKHDFQIQFGQSRLIVNEPLEIKLTIAGGGALENLEAPEILKDAGLEEFESNGDLKISNADLATKIFDYTFLAKQNVRIPTRSLVLSYFDPNSEKYVPVTLNVPEIVVAGGSANSETKPEVQEVKSDDKKTQNTSQISQKSKDLADPIFKTKNSWLSLSRFLNSILAVIALVMIIGFSIKANVFKKISFRSVAIPKEFKRGQFNLGDLTHWFSPIIQATGKSPLAIVKEADLSQECKSYFINLLNSIEDRDYSSRKTQLQFTYRASYFKEMGSYIESRSNESSSKSS